MDRPHRARALAIFYRINDFLVPAETGAIGAMHGGEMSVEEAGATLGPANAIKWYRDLGVIEDTLDVLAEDEPKFALSDAGKRFRLRNTGDIVQIEFYTHHHSTLGGPAAIVRKLDGSDEQLTTLLSNLELETANA